MIRRREGGNYLALTMITRRELFSPDYDYEEGRRELSALPMITRREGRELFNPAYDYEEGTI